MEQTTLFRACVKTARTRNKTLGPDNNSDRNAALGLSVKPLNDSQSNRDFSIKAKEIASSISKMRDFLVENRKDYINMNFVMYEASNMADSERDQIDRDALKFIHTCKDVIKNLRKEARKEIDNKQCLDHKEAVIEILETYLKAVCNIFSELKAIRIKRTVDKQKHLRLETGFRASKALLNKNQDLETSKLVEGALRQRVNSVTTSISSNTTTNGANATNNGNSILADQSKARQSSISDAQEIENAFAESNSTISSTTNFSAEEIQLFEQENKLLFDNFNNMVDDIRQIEGKVIEISRLQEVFSEKVLQQEQDANKVSDVTVGTTENIKDANEELRHAMRRNAGFRLSILFILIVLSFTILFLNWYND